jgi:hypothetical protein
LSSGTFALSVESLQSGLPRPTAQAKPGAVHGQRTACRIRPILLLGHRDEKPGGERVAVTWATAA